MTVGFLGGDRRMQVAADFLKKEGHSVTVFGEGTPSAAFFAPLDLLVLPYPATRDGDCVAMTELAFSSLPLSPHTALFGGRLPLAWRTERFSGDAEEDEEYLLGNAYLTAAAGVATALRAGERAFFRVTAAVIGYGRIGRETAKMLRALGASVTVYVRREEAKRQATGDGFSSKLLSETDHIPEDIVFGTVPAPAENLLPLTVSEDALLYDLGGGMPAEMKTPVGAVIRTLPLRGAPGVFAPQAAGELYAGAILRFLTQRFQNRPRKDLDP